MTNAVLDSSVIIALSHLNRFQAIDRVFTETIIPKAVYDEICVKGKGLTGSRELNNAIKQHKVTVIKPENVDLVKALMNPLEGVEAEAIALTSVIKPDYIVLDDRHARRKAQNMGLNVIGTLRVLRDMYKNKLLSLEELLDALNVLDTIGFHVSEQVIQEYIKSLEKT